MKHMLGKGLLCLCLALVLSAIVGTAALADVSINSIDELRAYLTGASTEVGVLENAITIPVDQPLTVTTACPKTLRCTGTATIQRSTADTGSLLIVPVGASLTLENVTLDGGGPALTATGPLIHTSGTLKLFGGTVLQNNRLKTGSGSGVYMAAGTLAVQGGVQITGNTVAAGSTPMPSNVYLTNGCTITVLGRLVSTATGSANIGVTTQSSLNVSQSITIAKAGGDSAYAIGRDDALSFQPDNEQYWRSFLGVRSATDTGDVILTRPEAVWPSYLDDDAVATDPRGTYTGCGTLREAFSLDAANHEGGTVGDHKGPVYLLEDITVSDSPIVTARQNSPVNITLVGYGNRTLKRAAGYTGYLMSIGFYNTRPFHQADFTLGGTAPYSLPSSLTFDGEERAGIQAALLYVNCGTVTIKQNVTLQNNRNPNGNGGGLYVWTDSSDMGDFPVSWEGGVIRNNSALYGGGVYIDQGYFIFSSGEIVGNTTTTAGGGVYVGSGNHFVMGKQNRLATDLPAPSIHDNAVTVDNQGGGGMGNFGGHVTLYDGSIDHNTSASCGGGIMTSAGTLDIYGGEICWNSAANNYTDLTGIGAGVYHLISGTTTITGGSIHDNAGNGLWLSGGSNGVSKLIMTGGEITDNAGAGVAMDAMSAAGSGMYVEGTAKVLRNGSAQLDNVRVLDGYPITVTGAMAGTSKIAVSAKPDLSAGEARLIARSGTAPAYTITAADAAQFVPDNTEYLIKLRNGGLYLIHPNAEWQTSASDISLRTYSGHGTLDEAFLANSEGGVCSGGSIKLLENHDLQHPLTPLVSCSLTGTNAAVKPIIKNVGVDTGDLLTISSGITFTLGGLDASGVGCGLTIDGCCSETRKVTGSLVQNSGSFTLESGATLTGNWMTGLSGGGGGVRNRGTFTMNGGVISGNTSGISSGGGVYNAGTFTMWGGIISDNRTDASGGGVFSGGIGVSFTMQSGEIKDNRAYNGGGVDNAANMTMSGGSITGNQATKSAGGLYVGSGADLTMTGGSITGNASNASNAAPTPYNQGGGVVSSINDNIIIGGTAVVSGNHQGTDSAAVNSNVYLPSGRKIAMHTSSPLQSTASIGITAEDVPVSGGAYAVAFAGGSGIDQHVACFHADEPDYLVKAMGGTTNQVYLTLALHVAGPANALADVGAQATFSVTASGSLQSYTYQWQRKPTGSAGFADIPSATSSTYTVDRVDIAMNGDQYRCVVKDTGTPLATVFSGPATLQVRHIITFDTQPAPETLTANGYILSNLTAAASVQPSGTVTLAWYACDQSGAISGNSLGGGSSFALPAALPVGTHYFLCQGTYPNAVPVNSQVAKVTVLAVPASPNSITGISDGQRYQLGEVITFTAHGAGMELHPPYPLNATRWKPDRWKTNPSGDFGDVFTQSFSTSGMTPGNHTLTATFVLQRYDGTNWVELTPRALSSLSVPYTLRSAPKTGDNSPLWLWFGLCLAAGAGLAVLGLMRWRKRKK